MSNFFKVAKFAVGITVVVALFICGVPCAAQSLEEMLDAAMEGGVYATPEKADLDAAEALFHKMFLNDSPEGTETDWNGLGFDLVALNRENGRAFAIREKKEQKRGRGFFLIFDPPRSPLALQIPHGFWDLDTDKIGAKLALEGNFSGAAWNTVPRYVFIDGKKIENDVADLYDTYFAAFSRAFVRWRHDGFVLQLHGFEKSKRKSPAAREADIIVSAGVHYAPPWLRKFDLCLEKSLKAPTLFYPTEVSELGGTQNSIGAILRSLGHDRFVHMETSRSLRIELERNNSLRKGLIECVSDALR